MKDELPAAAIVSAKEEVGRLTELELGERLAGRWQRGNAACAVIAESAHNLLRWTGRIGLPGLTVASPAHSTSDSSRCPAA